jgi:hypothetical protein
MDYKLASKMIKTFWQKYWIYLVPLLLCSLIMLPRLLDPHFGLMDDGEAIQKAYLIIDDQWDFGSETASGRFRPLYWYIHYVLFMIFGTNPLGYFYINYLVLVLLIMGVIKLLKIYGSSNPTILITCILFLLSGPIPESYFTLSKYEIYQLIFIVYSILMAEQYPQTGSVIVKVLLGLGVFLFSLVSYLIKETSLIMPVIYAGWLVVALFKHRKEKQRWFPLVVMLAGSLAAGVIYLIWRGVYSAQAITAGSYVGTHISFSISSLFSSMIDWEPWLRRDFSFNTVLIFTLILSLVLIRHKLAHTDIYWGASIWMVGWLGVFLPWVIKIEYYLLPFALGCSVLTAHVLVDLFLMIKHTSIWNRLISYAGIGVAGILFINSLLLIENNARYQLLMDDINSRMMKNLVDVVPPNGHVYVNLPADNEYIKEIELHFQYIDGRPDITVSRFYYQSTDSIDDGSVVISPIVVNRPTFSVRHAFSENDSGAWTYSLEKYMADGIGDSYNFSGQFTQIEPHIFRIICPIFQTLGSCEANSRILELKVLLYQWLIYPYGRLLENSSQPGIYSCGEWRLRKMDGTESTFNFGGCEDTPVVGDWNGDSISDLGVYTPWINEWKIDWNQDKQADLVFYLKEMDSADIPLVGDWDGDGRDTPGFFNRSSQTWYLYDGLAGSYQVTRTIRGGMQSSIPLIGDWNRDLKDTWGIYNPTTGEVNLENEFVGGLAGVDFTLPINTTVIVADWYGTGRDTLAFIDKTDWVILPANCACAYSNFPPPYRYSIGDGTPVSGIWPE